jgi:hypothetical protein
LILPCHHVTSDWIKYKRDAAQVSSGSQGSRSYKTNVCRTIRTGTSQFHFHSKTGIHLLFINEETCITKYDSTVSEKKKNRYLATVAYLKIYIPINYLTAIKIFYSNC